MPLLIFAGVGGGVGTSTVAAATALRLAERGQRVLFLSLGPTNLLIPDGHRAAPPGQSARSAQPDSVAAGLDALALEPQSLLAEAWADAETGVNGLLGRVGLEPIVEAELPTPPGVPDLLSVLAIARLAGSGRWDVVVLDGGDSAGVLRLAALPEVARWYLRRALPLRLGLAKGLRPLAAAARLSDDLAAAAAQLSSAGARVRLVVAPRRPAMADVRAQITGWALHGHLVRELIVNGVLLSEEAGGASWPPAWVAEHATQVAALRALAAEPELAAGLRALPQAAAPVDGADRLTALADLASGLFGPSPGADPIPDVVAPLLSVLEVGDPDSPRYELVLALPLADRHQVAASRSGSDLVVTAAGLRRVLPLPSVLQRCRVVGGRCVGGRLTLRFEPDERQWPRRQPRR